MSERYIYEVRPNKVIYIEGVGNVRVPKSYELTKQNVLDILPKSRVYRRFTEKVERVTTANIDRLHRAEYVSEEDWKQIQVDENATGSQQVVVAEPEVKKEEPVVEPAPVVEETPVVEEEPVKEEVNVDETEDTAAEEQQKDTASQDEAQNVIGEASTEESTEAAVVEEPAVEESAENKEESGTEDSIRDQKNTNQQQNYGKKKHKNR